MGEILASENKRKIESLRIREDGKEICDKRREMRIALANANNISYVPRVCEFEGSCAGTCKVCDEEAIYLYEELEKIDARAVVYPKFEIEVSM